MLKNYYYYFKSALDNETCDKIIKLGLEHIDNLKKQGVNTLAEVAGEKDTKHNPNFIPKNELTNAQLKEKNINFDNVYVRDSNIAWLDVQWIYKIIENYVSQANVLAGWNYEVDFSEIPQFTTYEKSGFYSWHKDCGTDYDHVYKPYIRGYTNVPLKKNGDLPSGYTLNKNFYGKIRKLSVTINLSDENSYEGGNLMFDFGQHVENQLHECTIARNKGSIIVFPSYIDHCVTPVTKGTRYSLVNWLLGRPFK